MAAGESDMNMGDVNPLVEHREGWSNDYDHENPG